MPLFVIANKLRKDGDIDTCVFGPYSHTEADNKIDDLDGDRNVINSDIIERKTSSRAMVTQEIKERKHSEIKDIEMATRRMKHTG